jgi:hypothetical protein
MSHNLIALAETLFQAKSEDGIEMIKASSGIEEQDPITIMKVTSGLFSSISTEKHAS